MSTPTLNIDPRHYVIPGENPLEFGALVREYAERFQPAGPTEKFLCELLLHSDWSRRRLIRAETSIRSNRSKYPDPDAAIASVIRLQQSNERSYFRALRELRRERKERLGDAKPAPTAARPQVQPQPQPAKPPVPVTPITVVSPNHVPGPIPAVDLGKGHPPAGLVFVG